MTPLSNWHNEALDASEPSVFENADDDFYMERARAGRAAAKAEREYRAHLAALKAESEFGIWKQGDE